MAFASQLVRLRRVVLSANKQNTYGTVLADGALTHALRFPGEGGGDISKEFFSDLELAKGHPWESVRTEVKRTTQFGFSGLPAYPFLSAWALAFLFGKVVTAGTDPYTHTFTPDLSTTVAPVTTIYLEDTAAVKFKAQDIAVASVEFSGGPFGVLQMAMELIGSGRHSDVAMTPPALVDPVFLLANNTDILLGPQAGAVSIKELVRSWSVRFESQMEDYRHPGSGLFSGFHRRGNLRARVSLTVAEKDTDALRTLFVADTVRELQINTNTAANSQLNFKFPKIRFRVSPPAAEGNFIVRTLEADESGIQKDATAEFVEAVAVNNQATYLVGA
jgi:hypothetical protein